MDKLTDFVDTSDVSDEEIEWVLHVTRSKAFVANVRAHAASGYPDDRAIIIAARLIKQHRSDLLVDPLLEEARERVAYRELDLDYRKNILLGRHDNHHAVKIERAALERGREIGLAERPTLKPDMVRTALRERLGVEVAQPAAEAIAADLTEITND